jgi:surface antigen
MTRSRLLQALLAALIGIGLATPAYAQVNPFRSRVRGLTSADMDMIIQAARRLLDSPDLANGSSSGWKNDQTGNSGIVTVQNTFRHQGMLCRKVNYEINFRARPQPRQYTVNWCKTADGTWKID